MKSNKICAIALQMVTKKNLDSNKKKTFTKEYVKSYLVLNDFVQMESDCVFKVGFSSFIKSIS